MAWILDLDGVVWLADQPVAGAAAAVERLRAAGQAVRFLTNNSSLTEADYLAKLARLGLPAAAGELLTSAQAAAALVEPGETVLVCGGPGVEEALAARGARTVRQGDADAVMVGWHRDFDFDRLAAASRAVRRGARLLATNDDATYPAPDGPLPGCGAILAAVATASGATATVAGKPYPPMVDLVRSRLGDALPGSTLVGDRPDTDGRMARALGLRFVLVLSGITRPTDLPVDPTPDLVATDLAAAVGP
jgi:HAD superfamily hydrolase (TIGR01450 family)